VAQGRPASTLVKLAYGYDPVGNRKYKEDLKSGLSTWSEVYFYDGLHRLRDFRRGTLNASKTAVTPIASPFVRKQEWLNFDLLGNWLESRATVSSTVTTDEHTVNSVNEYLTQQINGGASVSLASDDNGNLLDDGAQEYVYDAENRLTEVIKKGSPDETIQTYAYDALGRRVKTVDNCPTSCSGGCNGQSANTTRTTRHIFAGTPACIEEYDPDASPVLQRYFVHGTDFPDPLAMVDNTDLGAETEGTEEYFWYLKDALGSIVALKDANEDVVERYLYEPYGKTTVTDASGTPLSAPTDCIAAATPSAYANPFCWTGQRYDARVGLYHFWFRSYSPSLGRWLQRDPLDYEDSTNLYEYVVSSPSVYTDATGRGLRDWLKWLFPPGKANPLTGTAKGARELGKIADFLDEIHDIVKSCKDFQERDPIGFARQYGTNSIAALNACIKDRINRSKNRNQLFKAMKKARPTKGLVEDIGKNPPGWLDPEWEPPDEDGDGLPDWWDPNDPDKPFKYPPEEKDEDNECDDSTGESDDKKK